VTVQTGPGAHPNSCIRSFLGIKRPESGFDHLHPPSTLWAFVACSRVNSTFIVRVTKSRRIRWAEHVARMGEERGCIGSWWGNRREGDHWGDLGLDGWIIIGWISRMWDVGMWTGLGLSRIETGGGRL